MSIHFYLLVLNNQLGRTTQCFVVRLWRPVGWKQAPSLSALAAESCCHGLGWWYGPARGAGPVHLRRCRGTASRPAGLPPHPGGREASAGEHGRSCHKQFEGEEKSTANAAQTCCSRSGTTLFQLWPDVGEPFKSLICAMEENNFIITLLNVFDKDVVPDGSPCRCPGHSSQSWIKRKKLKTKET